MYILTPKGVAQKTKLLVSFMHRKMREYDEFKKELDSLQRNKYISKMKQNILKLENYPYYKILKIPNQKEKELKTKFLIYATKLGKIRSQNNNKDKIIEIKPNIKNKKILKKREKKLKLF